MCLPSPTQPTSKNAAQAKNLYNWEVPTDETMSPRTPRRKVGKPVKTEYSSPKMKDYAGQRGARVARRASRRATPARPRAATRASDHRRSSSSTTTATSSTRAGRRARRSRPSRSRATAASRCAGRKKTARRRCPRAPARPWATRASSPTTSPATRSRCPRSAWSATRGERARAPSDAEDASDDATALLIHDQAPASRRFFGARPRCRLRHA